MNPEPITCISRNGTGGWLATDCAECETTGGTCSELERSMNGRKAGRISGFDLDAAVRRHLAYLRWMKERIPTEPKAWSRRMHRKVDRMIADAEFALPEAAVRRALDTVAAQMAEATDGQTVTIAGVVCDDGDEHLWFADDCVDCWERGATCSEDTKPEDERATP